MMKIGDRFVSLQEAITAVRRYEKETHQLFVISNNSPKMRKTNDFYENFKYSRIIFQCKHGGAYRSHRKGQEITSRGLTTTTKMECPVGIRMVFSMDQKVFIVESLSSLEEHNHEVSEGIATFYAENRRLDNREKQVTRELLENRVAPRTIATTLNAARAAENRTGTVIAKDIFNRSAVLKKEKRGDRSEEQILSALLKQRKQEDPDGSYQTIADQESGELTAVYIQSGAMKDTFSRNSQVVFLDSTYR